MNEFVLDAEIVEIIERYAREVLEEKMRAAMIDLPYDYEGYEFRRDLPFLIAIIG